LIETRSSLYPQGFIASLVVTDWQVPPPMLVEVDVDLEVGLGVELNVALE
jgi:hypothetical protein